MWCTRGIVPAWGATCQLERCMPTDTWHVAGRMPRGMLHGILHGDCHRRMATATWHVAWRLPRGILHGECHVACFMATATWHVAWHSIWRLPRGMTHGECFMFQSRSCSAAVRSVLPGYHDRPKSEGRLQVGCNLPFTPPCLQTSHACAQPAAIAQRSRAPLIS